MIAISEPRLPDALNYQVVSVIVTQRELRHDLYLDEWPAVPAERQLIGSPTPFAR